MTARPEVIPSLHRADVAALAWAAVVFVCACAVRPHMMAGMINDEAVELLQALDLPADRWYYFAPSYRGGLVDLIEALPSYLNRALFRLFAPAPVRSSPFTRRVSPSPRGSFIARCAACAGRGGASSPPS